MEDEEGRIGRRTLPALYWVTLCWVSKMMERSAYVRSSAA